MAEILSVLLLILVVTLKANPFSKIDARKTALLLNIAGNEVTNIFHSLPPTNEFNYDEVVKLMTEYFSPSKNVLY